VCARSRRHQAGSRGEGVCWTPGRRPGDTAPCNTAAVVGRVGVTSHKCCNSQQHSSDAIASFAHHTHITPHAAPRATAAGTAQHAQSRRVSAPPGFNTSGPAHLNSHVPVWHLRSGQIVRRDSGAAAHDGTRRLSGRAIRRRARNEHPQAISTGGRFIQTCLRRSIHTTRQIRTPHGWRSRWTNTLAKPLCPACTLSFLNHHTSCSTSSKTHSMHALH
jgi:hypothetical protein